MQARLGEVADARRRLDELTDRWPDRATDLVVLAEASVLAAEGATADAAKVLQDAATADAAAGRVTAEAVTRHQVARLGFPELVADRLAELAAGSDSPLLHARAAYAGGLAAGDAAQLSAAGEAFAGFGAHLLAAEAFRDAARLLRAAGRSRPAAAATARAAAMLQRCESGRSPAALGPEIPGRLGRREREVAVLAAAGTPAARSPGGWACPPAR
ncbi:hypothetical protein BJF78_11685 [Pseudonocardia sp. CNS-139]|nr:hypothetical protein BJF78_11685 [Pseudonocardia sp. CNS-139]